MSRPVTPLRVRFEARVQKTDGCWLWQGHLDPHGYGRMRVGGRDGRTEYAHRVSFALAGRVISEGLELDHLCGNRACVNPAHLEAVTHTENVRRGKSAGVVRTGRCKRGHDQEVHGRRKANGRTDCRQCQRDRRAATRVLSLLSTDEPPL